MFPSTCCSLRLPDSEVHRLWRAAALPPCSSRRHVDRAPLSTSSASSTHTLQAPHPYATESSPSSPRPNRLGVPVGGAARLSPALLPHLNPRERAPPQPMQKTTSNMAAPPGFKLGGVAPFHLSWFWLLGALASVMAAVALPWHFKAVWSQQLLELQRARPLDLLAKVLGYFIIGLSLVLKVPQILRIVSSRSVRGLSVPTFELECVGYTVSCAYCWSRGVPFSAYGELTFLTAQGVGLVLLLYHFSRERDGLRWLKMSVYVAATALLLQGWLQPAWFDAIYVRREGRDVLLRSLEAIVNMQTILFFLSRIPQMWQNFSSRSTGELSLGTSAMSVGSCLMVFSSALGLLSHGLLLAQIVAYAPQREAGRAAARSGSQTRGHGLMPAAGSP